MRRPEFEDKKNYLSTLFKESRFLKYLITSKLWVLARSRLYLYPETYDRLPLNRALIKLADIQNYERYIRILPLW